MGPNQGVVREVSVSFTPLFIINGNPHYQLLIYLFSVAILLRVGCCHAPSSSSLRVGPIPTQHEHHGGNYSCQYH